MTVLVRVAALVVAVGLVLGGLALRGDDAVPLAGQGTERAPLVCPRDLAGLCRAIGDAAGLDVVTATAATTAAALVDGEDPDGVWFAPTAWLDLVDDGRTRSGVAPLERGGAAVASTRTRLVVWEERAAVLVDACDLRDVADLGWDCIGEQAGRLWSDLPGGSGGWGDVRAGHAAPDTGLGLVDTATVVAGRLGTGFVLQDLRDPTFTTWFAAVERSVQDHRPAQGRHHATMVVQGPSGADVAVTTEAEIAALDGASSSFGELVVVDASPTIRIDLVPAHPDPAVVAAVAEALAAPEVADAITASGWRTGEDAPGDPAVASGGALTALRDAWAEARN